MKNYLTTQKIFLFIGLIVFSVESTGQCKGFVKRADFSALSAFEYCGNVRAAKMYSGDEAVLTQKVEVGKRYRIVVRNHDYIGEVNLAVKDKAGKIIGKKVVLEFDSYWELMVEKDQIINIYLNAPEEKSTIGIASSACVAVAVGEMGNEELVAQP